jgi:hypothetical protein
MLGRTVEHSLASVSELPTAAPDREPGRIDELDGLSIEELEPRLTPDGWGWPGWGQHPSNSTPPPPPPDRQVGWGC